MTRATRSARSPWALRLALFAPGLLVAATGVGAGDLLTASLAGSRHGFTLLWAAWVGALLKWFLNEGVARWQMATGTTLLEGWVERLGRWARWTFLAYLLPWAFFTGGALVSACGVAGAAILPLAQDLRTSKIAWGIAHAVIGALLVWRGGFRTFARLMAGCVALMVGGVVLTAPVLVSDWGGLLHGLLVPRVPPEGTAYTLGVLGGVGGTVTLLSYGYWVRERGRTGARGAAECRIDLAAGYLLTALFGMAMIVIGSGAGLRQGPTAAIELADRIAAVLGPAGRWTFLLGFWGAVFSSLLGVWQGIPYLFADIVALRPGSRPAADPATTRAYRGFLLFLATAPVALLWVPLERAQLLYAVFGALFMPFLAFTLLLMNARTAWVGRELRNGWVTNIALVATLAVFAWIGWGEIAASVSTLAR
ncbi:MAG TPA: Nramp family divalent metal transporter [Gemmatimonadales bacterium]|jgi:Mn2+/Fe2+ NRAMP family transporter|nr:Nramp family divalent metal transporter [Gemmatimonadales bacterium]